MMRETATTKYDLPHAFEAAGLHGTCKCTAEFVDPIHRVDELLHPETAAHREDITLLTEKGV